MLKKIPKKFEGRYGFVNVAAARAHQLQCGAPPKTKVDSNKTARVAITECMEDLIGWDFLVEDTQLSQESSPQPLLKRAVNS